MTTARATSGGRRRLAFIVAASLVSAGLVGYFLLQDAASPTGPLADAASSRYVRPVGQLQLVAAMDPPETSDEPGFVGRDPATVPDSRIQVDIAVKLQEMNLPVEPLDIIVEDRRVTLEGRVEDQLLRDAIEVTVRSVEGVREVDNRIEVVGTQ